VAIGALSGAAPVIVFVSWHWGNRDESRRFFLETGVQCLHLSDSPEMCLSILSTAGELTTRSCSGVFWYCLLANGRIFSSRYYSGRYVFPHYPQAYTSRWLSFFDIVSILAFAGGYSRRPTPTLLPSEIHSTRSRDAFIILP